MENKQENRKYAILGIHDDKVTTVDGNVARVRMFIGDKQVDEDFPLPKKYPLTLEDLLAEKIEARIKELEASNV